VERSRASSARQPGSTPLAPVVMIAVDDEDPLVRHIQVVAGNRSLNGSAQAFRIEAVDVPGLTEPITRAVELGESGKSVDDLLGSKPAGGMRVAAQLVQDLVLRELQTGEKSRTYLDEVCRDELGINPDSVYRSGLMPLREQQLIAARKHGLNGAWHWRLTAEES
jgi:hypothetical protein